MRDLRNVGVYLLRADRKVVRAHLAVVHAVASLAQDAIGEKEHAKELHDHHERIKTVVSPDERLADVFHHGEELRAKIARPRFGGVESVPLHELGLLSAETAGPLSSDSFQSPTG